jgi:hypothetical protein
VNCPERERLWREYERTLDAFCDAVDAVGISSASALGANIIAASAAKQQCVESREAWENHSRDHLCDGDRKYLTAGGAQSGGD